MASLKYVADGNLQTVTLASAYTAADGHMHLTAGQGARLPDSGDFWMATTSGTYRCFKVTARSTDTITVTPAADGTSDGNLDAGAELAWVMGVAALDQLRTDMEVHTNVYLGASDADGSWRLTVSGTDLNVERRESGNWVTKGVFAA